MEEIRSGLELRSRVSADATLTLSLADVEVARPGAGEVVVRVEAAPINPSDLGLLLGPADVATGRVGGSDDRPTYVAAIPAERMASLASRVDQDMPVGIEGAGTVVQVGADLPHLLGRTVAVLGSGLYAQYRTVGAGSCIVLPHGATAQDGASMFVNPMTALAMVETLRQQGHRGLVHTAAASNLGQMLNRVCLADGVPLVNIVRSPDQAQVLRELGARHIVDSSAAGFKDALTDAVAETGATLAFDAVGGGKLASYILQAMESAANRAATAYSRYGSDTSKQVYIYGSLDPSPTIIQRSFGLSWGVNGFLITPFLEKLGKAGADRLRERVARELRTTFLSRYTDTISLRDALAPEVVERYSRKATGRKYLIDPSL